MRFIVTVLVGIAFTSCSPTKTDSTEEAKAAFEGYVTALNAGDIDTAAAMYDNSDGFHWIERGSVQYERGSEAAASLKGLSQAGGKARMTADDVRVAAMGDNSALVSAHFDYAMFDDAGKQQFSFDGWMTVGMVKKTDGWKIIGGQTGPGRAKP